MSKVASIKDNHKGFSLVELVIVVAILAILSILLLPRIGHYVHNTKHTREIADARLLAGEVSAYNALAKLNGTDTIPSVLPTSGTLELTKAMLDSTSLALPDEDSFPDNTIVRILIDKDGNTSTSN